MALFHGPLTLNRKGFIINTRYTCYIGHISCIYYVYTCYIHRLNTRKQSVLLDGTKSTEADVLSGVPQGTVLGPFSSWHLSTTYQSLQNTQMPDCLRTTASSTDISRQAKTKPMGGESRHYSMHTSLFLYVGNFILFCKLCHYIMQIVI